MTEVVVHDDAASSRRGIDVAVGIIMALQRCSQREAFEELAAAVRETGVSLGALSGALADLVAGAPTPNARVSEAVDRWGQWLHATR